MITSDLCFNFLSQQMKGFWSKIQKGLQRHTHVHRCIQGTYNVQYHSSDTHQTLLIHHVHMYVHVAQYTTNYTTNKKHYEPIFLMQFILDKVRACTIRLANKHDDLASLSQMEFSPHFTASPIKSLVRNPRVRITLYLK